MSRGWGLEGFISRIRAITRTIYVINRIGTGKRCAQKKTARPARRRSTKNLSLKQECPVKASAFYYLNPGQSVTAPHHCVGRLFLFPQERANKPASHQASCLLVATARNGKQESRRRVCPCTGKTIAKPPRGGLPIGPSLQQEPETIAAPSRRPNKPLSPLQSTRRPYVATRHPSRPHL